jgi:hypothetical protein
MEFKSGQSKNGGISVGILDGSDDGIELPEGAGIGVVAVACADVVGMRTPIGAAVAGAPVAREPDPPTSPSKGAAVLGAAVLGAALTGVISFEGRLHSQGPANAGIILQKLGLIKPISPAFSKDLHE